MDALGWEWEFLPEATTGAQDRGNVGFLGFLGFLDLLLELGTLTCWLPPCPALGEMLGAAELL